MSAKRRHRDKNKNKPAIVVALIGAAATIAAALIGIIPNLAGRANRELTIEVQHGVKPSADATPSGAKQGKAPELAEVVLAKSSKRKESVTRNARPKVNMDDVRIAAAMDSLMRYAQSTQGTAYEMIGQGVDQSISGEISAELSEYLTVRSYSYGRGYTTLDNQVKLEIRYDHFDRTKVKVIECRDWCVTSKPAGFTYRELEHYLELSGFAVVSSGKSREEPDIYSITIVYPSDHKGESGMSYEGFGIIE